MKTIFRWIDPIRLLAFLLFTLPFLAVFVFGIIWLSQVGNWHYWLIIMLVSTGIGYGLQRWLETRDRNLLEEIVTEPNPDWPPNADVAWQQVIKLADECDPNDWPLEDEAWVFKLGQQTLETVSHYYHPDVERPLLELTVPHTLLIIECASRDLRQDITENIPFSDRLTIGDLFKMQEWKTKADRVFDAYRVGRMVVNPVSGIANELLRSVKERSFNMAKNEIHLWLLRTYIRKVGYYAVDLYSGRQPLSQDKLSIPQSTETSEDIKQAEKISEVSEEPLRVLVLGRSNAGKSSLINALFGKLTTQAGMQLDTTQGLTPFVLKREGFTKALIFDTPGCDSPLYDKIQILQAAEKADLILWVSPVNRPDRQVEFEHLDALRAFQERQTDRQSPPILIVASFIDQLRPVRVWQPPYDLANPQEPKAVNISVAVQAVAADFKVAIDHVIPVCLQEGNTYNVDDVLWAAIMDQQDNALKARLHRYLCTRKYSEELSTLRKQFVNAGRFLWKLPGKRSD